MYKASEDYPRLKELLDNGERIVCYVDFTVDLSSGERCTFRDVADAIRREEPCQYEIGVRGHGYCSVYPEWFRDYSDEALFKLWAFHHVQFIDPDYERNNIELVIKK